MDNPARTAARAAAATTAEAVANIKVRLAQAESNTSQLRQVGPQDKYEESYCLVEALESQLARLSKEQRVKPAV